MTFIATTKSKFIYTALKRKILSGELRPDTRLVIRQLAKLYDSSDIPVREALMELAADGLIEMNPHKGSRVKKHSTKELKDMLTIRKALEPLAAALAAENSTPELVEALQASFNQSKKFSDEKNFTAYSDKNREFHQLILDASDNIYLKKILGELLRNELRTKSVFEIFPEILAISQKEHCEMIELIREKKSQEIYELMLKHKTRSYDKLQSYFSKQEEIAD